MGADETAQIQRCVDGLRVGDAGARDAPLACAAERLARLTHKTSEGGDYRVRDQVNDPSPQGRGLRPQGFEPC